jgi:hypothetical protein
VADTDAGPDQKREVDPQANVPERPGVANLIDALNVRRNAAVGFGLGILFTLFIVYVYVILPDRAYSLGLWATLGFVLAVGTGLLLSAVFTLGSAFRRARELE